MIPIKNAKTFKNDLHLPWLPLPSLKKSLLIYSDILNTFMPTYLFLSAKEELDKFGIEDSFVLEKNHQKSLENNKNWLEKWWLDTYHLKTNDELIPFCSICGISSLHETIWTPDIKSQIDRAAKYLYGLLTCWTCLRYEVITPDRSDDGETLSMHMYRSVFNAGRIPADSRDIVYRYFKTICEGECPSHIVLSIKGCTFKANYIDEGIIWPVCRIKNSFREIMEFLKTKDIHNNLNPATSLPKSHLLSAISLSNSNSDFIETIKTSILWLAFDDSTPTPDNALLSVMTADSQDRCGIKSLSLTVFANGIVGLSADSALIDPIIFSSIIHFTDRHIFSSLTKDDYPLPLKDFDYTKPIPKEWTVFDFNIPGIIRSEIDYIKRHYNIKAYQLDCAYQFYKGYNLKLSKSWKVDPCVTVHLLILLTNWKINKSPTSTCAIVSHRKFYRGREDVLPTNYLDVNDLIQAISSSQCSYSKLKTLFLLAHKKLQTMFKYCENNCGPVLHLNFLRSCFLDTSRYLADICANPFWHQTGFNNTFGIRTYWLGNQNIVIAIPPNVRTGLTISYSVTEESTLVTAAHRCWDDQINPKYTKLFLKEFLASVDFLNKIFTEKN